MNTYLVCIAAFLSETSRWCIIYLGVSTGRSFCMWDCVFHSPLEGQARGASSLGLGLAASDCLMPSWPADAEQAHTDGEDGGRDNDTGKPRVTKMVDSGSLENWYVSVLWFNSGKHSQSQTQRDEKLEPVTRYCKRICLFEEGLSRGLFQLASCLCVHSKCCWLMCSFAGGF